LDASLIPKIQSTNNPFATLDRESYRAFARAIRANNVFVGKLRDRQIDPGTITDGFRRRVADELRTPLNVIVTFFAAGVGVQTAPQYYKSDQKPVAMVQETFEAAVHSSGLTAEQRVHLLSL
jgi:hypothetical protein